MAPEAIELIGDDVPLFAEDDEYRTALVECLEKLAPRARQAITRRTGKSAFASFALLDGRSRPPNAARTAEFERITGWSAGSRGPRVASGQNSGGEKDSAATRAQR